MSLEFTRPFTARHGCEEDYVSPVPEPVEEAVVTTSGHSTEEL